MDFRKIGVLWVLSSEPQGSFSLPSATDILENEFQAICLLIRYRNNYNDNKKMVASSHSTDPSNAETAFLADSIELIVM